MNKTVLSGLLHVSSIIFTRKKYLFWALVIFLGVSIYSYSILRRQSKEITLEDTTTESSPETQEFLINTPGCFIPNYAKQFSYSYDIPIKRKSFPDRCGKRVIFVDTLDTNNVTIRMNTEELKKIGPEFHCCYKFVNKSVDPEEESDVLTYTPCKKFSDNEIVALDHEIILVKCYKNKPNPKRLRKIIYEDSYVKIKKIYKDNSQSITENNKTLWNILMIGIQGMSRTRMFDTMPLTARYLQYNDWLDYKGYQKIGQQNTSFGNFTSLFDKMSPNRTCAGVSEVWCSCHNMTEDETDDEVFDKRVKFVSSRITNKLKYIKTATCTTCKELNFLSIRRSHQYSDGNKTYYVIAFTMVPRHLMFEAVVENFNVLQISSISGYNFRGNCALNPDDRPYCVCTLNSTCNKYSNTHFLWGRE